MAFFAWYVYRIPSIYRMEFYNKSGTLGLGNEELQVLANRLRLLDFPLKVETLVLLHYLLFFILSLIGFILIAEGHYWGIILLFIAVVIKRMTNFILTFFEKKRREILLRDLPLLLDQIRIYSKAVGYFHAIKITARSIKGKLGKELELMSAEMEFLGVSKAVIRFADRCNISEFRDFAQIIIVEETTGADIGNILFNFSTMIRQRQISLIKRKIKLQPIFMSILPGILIVLLMLMFILPLVINILNQIESI
jgi:Flp pilus assembly protein TadB